MADQQPAPSMTQTDINKINGTIQSLIRARNDAENKLADAEGMIYALQLEIQQRDARIKELEDKLPKEPANYGETEVLPANYGETEVLPAS